MKKSADYCNIEYNEHTKLQHNDVIKKRISSFSIKTYLYTVGHDNNAANEEEKN